MDNYRKYIEAYNFKTVAENHQTIKHNVMIEKFLAENVLNEVQKEFSILFIKKNKSLSARIYNILADELKASHIKTSPSTCINGSF